MEAPKPGTGDVALALGGGALGMIPIAGSAVQSIYQLCIVPPFQRKVQTFLADVAQTLDRHGVALEQLADDDRFHDAAMRAALLAGRTRDAAKREALRNTVLNVVRRTVDEAHEDLFLGWVETLSPSHLAVLHVLDAPLRWFEQHQRAWGGWSSVGGAVAAATGFPRVVYDPIVSDLHSQALVDIDANTLQTRMSTTGPQGQRTTTIGRAFLSFLREPPLPAPPA